MDRTVTSILPAQHVIDDGDMLLLRALPQPLQTSLGPFVFIDHYQHDGPRGIGDRPHPHAGIEVVSYLLEGSAEHRDSMGYRDTLGPGDAQFIRAGRGMLHAEQPLSGRHGLQLWISLPPDMKLVEPTYTSLPKADIPALSTAESTVHVVAGHVNDVQGPMGLTGGAVFARVQIGVAGTATLAVDAGLELGVYVLDGEVDIDGTLLSKGMLGNLGDGTRLRITATGTAPVELALLGGLPVQGEVLFSGPFVMDTPERLAQAKRDFAQGKMGRLDGMPF